MKRLALVLLLVTSMGCHGAVTGQGAFGGIGAGSMRSCSEPVEGETVEHDCTIMEGAAISVPGAQLFGGVIALAAGLTAKLFGVPAVTP